MARDVIDELSLKIDIDVDKGASKTISSLARAITKLNTAVANVGDLHKYVRTLNKLDAKSINVRGTTGVGKVSGKTITPKYQDIPDSNGQTTQSLKNIEASANGAANAIKNVGEETNKTNKELSKGEKPTRKYEGTFKKLIRSIGRIAFYRTIRFAIKQLTDAFREGFQNVVQYDKETNEAMSRIMNSANQLKNSLGVGLASVLKSLEPIIVSLTDNMVDFVNALNLAFAKMRGDDTYIKAIKQNEDYAKSLEKTKNSLLSFDKFEALNDSKNKSPFEEVGVGDEQSQLADTLSEVFNIVKDLAKVVKDIVVSLRLEKILPMLFDLVKTVLPPITKLIESLIPILEVVVDLVITIFEAVEPILEPVIDLIDIIVTILTPVIKSLIEIIKSVVDVAGGILTNVAGIVQFISGLLKLLTGDFEGAWESIANGFANMVNGIANMFIGLVNFILDMVNLILEPFDVVASWFGGDIPELQWNAKANWKPYANGGTFNKGTAFIAGEAGAEAVYNTSGGNGGVVNIEQFTTAMYNALSMYGVARSTDVHFGGDVYIDRTKAGQLLESSVYGEGVRVGHFAKR